MREGREERGGGREGRGREGGGEEEGKRRRGRGRGRGRGGGGEEEGESRKSHRDILVCTCNEITGIYYFIDEPCEWQLMGLSRLDWSVSPLPISRLQARVETL